MTIAILTALSLTLTLIFPHSFTVYASAFVSLSISGRYGTVSGSSSQSTQPTTSASSAAQEQSEVVNIHNHIVFPGGGIFFYHQAGIVTYMREEGYDLSRCTMAGASAGALVASLTANDVDFYEAARVALQMAADANVWDRPLGLAGIWGDMNRDWLNQLLPRTTEEVLANVQGRVNLLVTPFPSLGKSKILTFKDRSDFIEANLASIHLPLFMDGKLTYAFRNKPHIDGSFLSKETDYSWEHHRFFNDGGGHNKDDTNEAQATILKPTTPTLTINTNTLILDWKDDPEMKERGGLDIIEALSPDGIYDLMERGRKFGRRMEKEGAFDTIPRGHFFLN